MGILQNVIIRRIIMILGMVFMAAQASAQGDGPRAYQLVPDKSNVISQYFLSLQGNTTTDSTQVIEGSDLTVELAVTQYTKALDLNGRQVGFFAVLPFADVDGSLDTSFGRISGGDRGLGDAMLGAIVGIAGSPVLSREQYVKYEPGFAMGIMGRVTLPTGEYDSSRILNPGANRYTFQVGAPMMYYIGKSFLDPNLTSFELHPSVTFFGNNDDPTGSANLLEQKPIFNLEGHITRNFGQAFWASLDAYYQYGGETTTDGVDGDNTQRSFALGATAAVNLSASTSLKFTYGKTISSNASGPDGEILRAQLQVVF